MRRKERARIVDTEMNPERVQAKPDEDYLRPVRVREPNWGSCPGCSSSAGSGSSWSVSWFIRSRPAAKVVTPSSNVLWLSRALLASEHLEPPASSGQQGHVCATVRLVRCVTNVVAADAL